MRLQAASPYWTQNLGESSQDAQLFQSALVYVTTAATRNLYCLRGGLSNTDLHIGRFTPNMSPAGR